jgi:transcription antitermination factor NusA-like protein
MNYESTVKELATVITKQATRIDALERALHAQKVEVVEHFNELALDCHDALVEHHQRLIALEGSSETKSVLLN